MECKRCKAKKVLVEGLTEGKSKITCQECGESYVVDGQNRQLLTSDVQSDKRSYLTEG